MGIGTGIEWCDGTINPIVGCTKCSPGCDNCFAERMAWRQAHNTKTKPETREAYRKVVVDGKWSGKTVWRPEALQVVEKWKSPKRIFVCSMSDVFHETVPWVWVCDLKGFFAKHLQHTFILLTKRPQEAVRFGKYHTAMKWPRNVWMGVTVCNQEEANNKIPLLLQIDVAVKFVSVEPMLGAIDLWPYREKLDWVICGGETGPGARKMEFAWVKKLIDVINIGTYGDMGVPFFFKGWGGVRKEKDNEWIDGKRWQEFPVTRATANLKI